MAEDDLEFIIQASGGLRSQEPAGVGWGPVTGLPAEVKDLLWAQAQAADLLPYQLPGARRPSLGTVYVRQDVGSDVDDAPADHQPAPRLDEHGQLVEIPAAPAVVRAAVRPPSKPMRSALDNDEHLVITGGPGQGKSTLTLRLTADIVKAWSAGADSQVPIAEPVLPLRLPARVLAAHLGLSISQTLASSASAEYGRYLSNLLDPALFAHRVAGCRWLLLIDALDEVADSDARAEIVHTLAAWASKGTYRVLLTTRPAEGGTLAPLQRSGAARYELLPFDEEALHRFAAHWFEDENQTRTFLRQIRDAHLFELVAVPLLATIAAIVFEQHGRRPLPGNQYQLYESYLAFIESSRPTPEPFERHRTALVEHLGLTRLRSDVPLTTAVRDWAGRHQDAGTEDDLLAHLTAVGPFVPRGGDLTFLHHSFAEHVAATAEARDLPEEFDPDHPAVAELLHQAKPLETGRFARSVLLHYTHLHPNQADKLVQLLNSGTGEQHLLAARLLANHLPASASSIDDFLVTVRGWAMTTQSRAGAILSRASRATHHPRMADWLIDLLRDEAAPWESRAEAATALAVRLRDPLASEALVFLRAAVEDMTAPAEHRLTAAEALADSGTAERDAAERGLRSVLADPLASGLDCKGASVVLSAFGGKARECAVEALERVMSDVDTPVEDLVRAATGLAEIGIEFHDRCADVLLSVLRDRVHSVEGRRDAAVGLAALGRPQAAAEALAAFVTDRRVSAGLRGTAASALGALGPRQRADAGELLLSQLDAGPSERRLYPTHIVRLCAREAGVEHLRRALADRGAQWGYIIGLASALAGLGPAFHDEAAAHLEGVLEHCPPARYEIISCFRELAGLGEPHRGKAITRMRAGLTDLRTPPKTRCHLAGELVRCGPEHHSEAIEQLLLIAGSERDPEVVWQAWTELRNLGPALSERARAELLSLAGGRYAASQLASLGSLFYSSDAAGRRAVAELLTAALADEGLSLHKRLMASQGLIWLGRAFHRTALEGVRSLVRSGQIFDIVYVARIFTSAGRGARAALAAVFLEILDDAYSDQFRAWRAAESLDILGHDVPETALRRIAGDVFADLDDRARAAIMLARNDNTHLAEAADLTFRACRDMSQESWSDLVADLAALGIDVRPRLREMIIDRNRPSRDAAAAASLLGVEELSVLRRHVDDAYLDFRSRSNAYRMLVEADSSVQSEATDAHLSVLHDPDQQIHVRSEAATALALLDRTLQPAMCEVLWRFAESSYLGVGERASAAEALATIDAPMSPRLVHLIVGLARDPDLGDSRKADLGRRLPRPHRTMVEELLLTDHSVASSHRIPQLDLWDDAPLRAEAEATVREILSAPESGSSRRRAAAVALSRLSARVDQEAIEFLLAEGTASALAAAATQGASRRVRDHVCEVVADGARPMRERRAAALLVDEISDEPLVRTFLMEDRDAPWRLRVDELRCVHAFDELRSIRDDPAALPAQRWRAISCLTDLSLDDREACAGVLATIAADPAVRPALRWRAAEDLAELGRQGRTVALSLLEVMARDADIGVSARHGAAAEICSLSPTRRPEMLAVLRGLLPLATPLLQVNVLYSIGVWSDEARKELRAMAADAGLSATVRLSAAYNLVSLRSDEKSTCALVAREVATNERVRSHVRRRAARRLALWGDECREEARALLAEL